MKILSLRITLIVFTSITIISCTSENSCNNRFAFASCNSDIPIIDIDYAQHTDSIRAEIESRFDYNLCDSCRWVYIKIPFTIEGEPGYLKLMVDYDSPVCGNCGIPIRLRYYYRILMNAKNQLLVEGKYMHKDSLLNSIYNYFNNVGNPKGFYPENFKKVNFSLHWDRETDPKTIEEVLTNIYSAHLKFVEKKTEEAGLDFCNLSVLEINELKEKYPLRIEFFRKLAPPPPNAKMLKEDGM